MPRNSSNASLPGLPHRSASLPEKGSERRNSHGFSLRGPSTVGAGASESGEKSNEIIAVVIIDAMGCLRDIAKRVIDKKVDCPATGLVPSAVML
jgi:hypothetical protein